MRARSRPCRLRRGCALPSRAGHMRARSRPRRSRRGRALRISASGTHNSPLKSPPCPAGGALCAYASGTHARPLTSPPYPAGVRSVHSERDTCVPAHAPAVDGGGALFHSEWDTCVPAHVPAVVSGGAPGPGPARARPPADRAIARLFPWGRPSPPARRPSFSPLERGGSARVRGPRRPFLGVPPIYSARVWPSVPTPVSAGRAPRRPRAPRCLFFPLRPQGDHFSPLSLWSRARSVRFALQPAKPTS